MLLNQGLNAYEERLENPRLVFSIYSSKYKDSQEQVQSYLTSYATHTREPDARRHLRSVDTRSIYQLGKRCYRTFNVLIYDRASVVTALTMAFSVVSAELLSRSS
jgi:hypothetical protein